MGWEFDVLYWFQSTANDFLNGFWKVITLFSEKGIFFGALLLLLLIFAKDKRIAITGILAIALDLLICNLLLKNMIARDRPCWLDPSVQLLVKIPDDFSFPSGHTAFAFAFASSIVQYKKWWGLGFLGLATLIGISRLYLFVHFPTDVIAGALIGIFCGLLAGLIVKSFWEARGYSTKDGWKSFRPIREEDA